MVPEVTRRIYRSATIALVCAVLFWVAWRLGHLKNAVEFVAIAGIVRWLSQLHRNTAPISAGEWKTLGVGWMEWIAIGLGTVLTLLFAYIFFFVGSARRDAAQQMLMLELLLVSFALMTAYALYLALMVTIRWNAWQLEQESWLFGKRAIRFADVCRVSPLSWANMLRISSIDGTRIYVPLYRRGTDVFMEELAAKLGPDTEARDEANPGG
jgi:hypothetical protein